tara:strand:- start:286 stop:570 length:285 start_codon:yes stop_codon:yes gene_type:complete
MIAYSFRAMTEHKPSVWVGFAFAQNMKDLFWQIDNHIDPYKVEIKKMQRGSACLLLVEVGEDFDESDHEINGYSIPEESGWKTPVWVTDPDFVV